MAVSWYGMHTFKMPKCGSLFCKYDGMVWYGMVKYGMGQAGIMVVIDMSDSTPALHYNSLPRIVEQLISYFYFIHALLSKTNFSSYTLYSPRRYRPILCVVAF